MILKAVKDSMIIMIMTSSLGGSRQIEPPKSVQGPIARAQFAQNRAFAYWV